MSPQDKVALITGAAQGLGYAIAERLAQDGFSIGIADLNAEKAGEAAAKLGNDGAKTLAIEINVADSASVNEGVAKLEKDLGPANVLINNAGIYKSTPLMDGASMGAWRLSLEVMLTGSLLMARAVAPGMIAANWGRIVNLGSLVSQTAFGEDAGYATAKTGMLGLTRSLAAELAKYNICVNTVCPGNILTDLLRQTGKAIEKRENLEPGSWISGRANDIPLGRLGDPKDIAKAVSFFCSEDADYITGQSLHVNGGLFQY